MENLEDVEIELEKLNGLIMMLRQAMLYGDADTKDYEWGICHISEYSQNIVDEVKGLNAVRRGFKDLGIAKA